MDESLKVLKRIESLLVTNSDDSLWTIADVATYLRRSESTVRQTVIKQLGFPKPIYIPGLKKPMWQGDLVKIWANKPRREDS